MPPSTSVSPRWTPSIQGTLMAAMVLMGGLAVLLSLLTGEVFSRLSLENQRDYLTRQLAMEVHPALTHLGERMLEMAEGLRKEPGFEAALREKDEAALGVLLDEQFHQYYVTAGLVPVAGLGLGRPDLSPLAVATEGEVDPWRACPATLRDLAARDRVDRLRPAAALCLFQGRPLWLSVSAVGGLRPRGYVVILADPVPALMGMAVALGLPVAVETEAGRSLARSEDWPAEADDRWLVADYPIAGEGGVVLAKAAQDVRPLLSRLGQVQMALVALAALATVVLTFLLWRRIRRIALVPLDRLQAGLARLSRVHPSEHHPLPETGGREVRVLTRAFNATSEELHNLYRTLEQMAYTDALTRLPNRTRFNEMLELHTRLNRHRLAPFALLVMDLDRFKWVNDTLGHLAGDALLAEVAQRLGSVLRKTDVVSRLEHEDGPVARLGGDEFAALIPGVRNEQEAAIVAAKIAAAMDRPFLLEGREVSVGISIGIALSPQHGREPKQLMRLADVAMYQAKQGGHAFQVYDEARDQSRLFHETLEGALREAVFTGRGLSLVYQPQVNVERRRVEGVEALLRWQGLPERAVGPDEFIPVAEEIGLMPRLTRWVLGTALDQVAAWRRAGCALRVAVNLSAHNLAEADFARDVECALASRGLPASCLCLEITETQLVSDPDRALAQLQRLSAMGVRLALDDFGTGYSSLTYLRRLPLDEIKIDRHFVSGMLRCPEDRVIVEAVVGLARGLGKAVLAEGVEELAVQEALRAMGCRLQQGYFISPPLPAEELEAWWSDWCNAAGRASS